MALLANCTGSWPGNWSWTWLDRLSCGVLPTGSAPLIIGAPTWPGNCEKPALPICPLKLRSRARGSSTMPPRYPPVCDCDCDCACDCACDTLDRSERVDLRLLSLVTLLSLLLRFSLRRSLSRAVDTDDSA